MKIWFCVLGFIVATHVAPRLTAASAPLVVVTIKSLDEILSDVRAVSAKIGNGGPSSVESVLGRFGLARGIPGVDGSRPLGICLDWDGKSQVSASLLVPLRDAKAFVGLFGLNDSQAAVIDGRTFALQPFGQSIYARISGSHCTLATRREDAEQPPNPSRLASGPFDLWIQTDAGQLPPARRRELVQTMKSALDATDAKILERARHQPGRNGYLAGAQFASEWRQAELVRIIEDGDRFACGFRLDGKSGTLGIDWEILARPGTSLATEYNRLATAAPVFGGLWSTDAAIAATFAVPVPAGIRELLLENFGRGQELVQGEVDRSPFFSSPDARANANDSLLEVARAFEGLKELNGAVIVNAGPGQKPLVIVALSVANGSELLKAFGRWGKFPPAVFSPGELKINAELHTGIGLHKLAVPALVGEPFGGTSAYFAVRGNALYFTLGHDSLPAVKYALDRTKSMGPRRPPLSLRITPSKLLSFVGSELDLRGKRIEHAFRGTGDLMTYEMIPTPNGVKGQIHFGEGFLRAIATGAK